MNVTFDISELKLHTNVQLLMILYNMTGDNKYRTNTNNTNMKISKTSLIKKIKKLTGLNIKEVEVEVPVEVEVEEVTGTESLGENRGVLNVVNTIISPLDTAIDTLATIYTVVPIRTIPVVPVSPIPVIFTTFNTPLFSPKHVEPMSILMSVLFNNDNDNDSNINIDAVGTDIGTVSGSKRKYNDLNIDIDTATNANNTNANATTPNNTHNNTSNPNLVIPTSTPKIQKLPRGCLSVLTELQYLQMKRVLLMKSSSINMLQHEKDLKPIWRDIGICLISRNNKGDKTDKNGGDTIDTNNNDTNTNTNNTNTNNNNNNTIVTCKYPKYNKHKIVEKLKHFAMINIEYHVTNKQLL